MKTRSLIIAAAALWLNACAPAEQVNEIAGEIDGQSLFFTPVTAAAELKNNQYHLDIQGSAAHDHGQRQLSLSLVIDSNTISKSDAAAQLLNFKGDSWFASNAAQPQWFPAAQSNEGVVAAWASSGCTDCAGLVSQHVIGSLDVHFASETVLQGRLIVTVSGVIPGWSATGNVDAIFEVLFDLPVVQTAPPVKTPAAPVDETPVVDETQEQEETETKPSPVVEEPAPEPEPELAPAKSVPGANYSEVTLVANTGINFSTGQTFKMANYANSDLFATQGSSYLKLTPGGSKSTKTQPIRWFKTNGGLVKTFNSLDNVPWEYPTDAEASKSLVSAKPGVGFVVRNNLSDGYTRVWIKTGDSKSVTIQYQYVPSS